MAVERPVTMVIRLGMSEKKFTGAPFGCQSARFDVSGIHPEYKKPGAYTQVSYCKRATSEQGRILGPGRYEAAPGDFSASVLERKASAPGWKRAEETEKLTEMPHVLYRETWVRNRLLKQNLGPGRYNIKSFTDLMDKPSSVLGVCSTREVRFKEDSKDCFPGPGTYGKGGNPYTVIEERATKSASSKEMMDSEASRWDSPVSTGSGLAPGMYNAKNSTNEILKHSVGKRGPYDVFTGSRSQPIASGYFAAPKRTPFEPGQYNIKSFLEELEGKLKGKHGHFGKISQYPKVPTERVLCSSVAHWPRPVDSPGPGSYDKKTLFAPVRQSSAPFLTSAKRYEKKSFQNQVGVGRYDISKPLRGKTATSYRTPFLNKTGRYLSNPQRDKLLQERIQKSHTPSAIGRTLETTDHKDPPSTA